MRLNQFLARHTQLSRREADKEIEAGNVTVNGQPGQFSMQVSLNDQIAWNGSVIRQKDKTTTVLFHKPKGFICSKNGQGGKTIYEIIPEEFRSLNPAGRLDKDSSGLLVLTNDGDLAHRLTHPSYQKIKQYEIALDKPLAPLHQQMISDFGIDLEDGKSQLYLEKIGNSPKNFIVTMHEGRNRQIRRTFLALGYNVTKLHRTIFGDFSIGPMEPGEVREVN